MLKLPRQMQSKSSKIRNNIVTSHYKNKSSQMRNHIYHIITKPVPPPSQIIPDGQDPKPAW